MVKVSVIMPSLNVGNYIKEALDSAIHQTLSDIEIICVDAGSTDGTLELIKAAAYKDDRVLLIESPVKSYGFQVNLGIEKATGEYLAVLETDDFVSHRMYENLYRVAKDKNLDFVKCDYSTYTTENGEKKFIERKISVNDTLYTNVFRPLEHPDSVIDDWYLWNGIYKTEFIKEKKIKFSETLGAAFQDVGFLHKVAANADRGIFVGESLYRYCVDREGASSNSDRILKFIRKEYGLLLDDVSEAASQYEKILLYRRMARSFVRACMDSDDDILSKQELSDICKWFQRQLSEAERWGYLSENDLPNALRKGYRHLMNPAEGYMAYRKVKQMDMVRFLGDGNKIIIFGCGNYGREALKMVTKKGYDIYAFMDNNPKLWGEKIDGIQVVSPEETQNFPKETRFLIANEKYADSIREQLKKYRDNILTFEYTPEGE